MGEFKGYGESTQASPAPPGLAVELRAYGYSGLEMREAEYTARE